MTTDWAAFEAAWNPLDEQLETITANLRSLLETIRATQSVPTIDIARALAAASVCRDAISAASVLDPPSRRELLDRLTGMRSALEFLFSWSRNFTPLTPDEVQDILAGQGASLTDDCIHSCRRRTELLMLARPSGQQFWDLARDLHADIERELRSADRPERLELQRYRSALYQVVPAWTFKDRSQYGTNTKYGYRPVEIDSVVQGGLPGLVRRN